MNNSSKKFIKQGIMLDSKCFLQIQEYPTYYFTVIQTFINIIIYFYQC